LVVSAILQENAPRLGLGLADQRRVGKGVLLAHFGQDLFDQDAGATVAEGIIFRSCD
jgi:hypothetical protein